MPNKRPDRVWQRCRIRTERLKLAMSLGDLAKEVKLSRTGIWQIENGSDPMLSTAVRIANFFKVDLDYLWPNRIQGAKTKNEPQDPTTHACDEG